MRIKAMKVITAKTKIRHRNELNQTLAQLPLSAKRVLCLALVSIDTKKPIESGQVFRVTAETYAKIAQIDISVAYKQIKEGAELLSRSQLSLSGDEVIVLAKELGLPFTEKNKPDNIDLSITDFCAYSKNEGYLAMRFTRAIEPYISNLIGTYNKFTTQLLTSAIKLNGQYSGALYQLIRKNYSRFKNKNYFSISVNALKDELIAYTINDNGVIDYKYPDYPIFKREVINKAIKEIKDKTEISFLSCLVESKEGRKVSVLRFEFVVDEESFSGNSEDIKADTLEPLNTDDAEFLELFDKKFPSGK